MRKATSVILLTLLLMPLSAQAYIGGSRPMESIRSTVGIIGNGSLCTGAKVAERIILTAHHCVSGVLNLGQKIELLTTTGISPGSITLVTTITNIWTAPYGVDMALVEVARPLTRWDTAKISYTDVRINERLWVGGHGCKGTTINNDGLIYTGDYKRSAAHAPEGEIEFESQSAQSSAHTFSCSGDSGSPVIRRFGGRDIIVGVIKTVGINQDEFEVDAHTGRVLKMPVRRNSNSIRFQADKIYSADKAVLKWLGQHLPSTNFTWD